jgi:Xaa-Pro aminopeptidase
MDLALEEAKKSLELAEVPVGAVVTDEPGIYLPGRFGVRIEDFGVMGQDGFEPFTQSTHDLVCIEC